MGQQMKFLETISRFFDFVLAPFAGMTPAVGLTAVSVVTGVVMVFLYKWTTDQETLKEIRDQIKIHFLEIRLYKDDMAEMFSIQKDILRENLKYLRYTFKAAILLIIPILFIIFDLNVRYSYHPIRPGGSFIVSAFAEEGGALEKLKLSLPPSLTLEVPAIRVAEENRVSWQVRSGSAGSYNLAIHQGEKQYSMRVSVSNRVQRIYTEKDKGHRWTSRILPGAEFIPEDALLQKIRIEYPEQSSFLGLQPGWLYYFFLVSMAAGLLVRRWIGLA
jgi:uncharacterized membrane protein (DUF106 family)